MAATITLRLVEPIVDGLINLVKNNLDDYLAGVEALYISNPIALPRPKPTSYFVGQKVDIDDYPAVFVFGDASRQKEQTGSHVVFAEPGGGHDLTLQFVMHDDDPQRLRRKIYRVALALFQMVADNYRLGIAGLDFIEIVNVDYQPASQLLDGSNVFEQAVELTLLAQTQELK